MKLKKCENKTLSLVFWIDCGYSHAKHRGKELYEPEEQEFENLIPKERCKTERTMPKSSEKRL